MPYIVKYIDNCLDKEVDWTPLCEKELKNGYRIVLLCDEKYKTEFVKKNVPLVNNVEEAKSCESNLMVTYHYGDGLLSAAQCAHMLRAECQVYIGVDGIYSADPKESFFAHKLEKIDYDEVLEICAAGYRSINSAMVEYCRKYGIVLHLLSYNDPESRGTIIKEVMGISGLTVKGVIKDPNICIISLKDIPDIPGISYHIFKSISDAGIIVDIINLPAAFAGTQDISLTVPRADRRKAEKILLSNQSELLFSQLIVNDNVAKVSVIGAALRSTSGVATTVFKILYENNINLMLINTSEIKISVVVDKSVADLAVQKIHEAFID